MIQAVLFDLDGTLFDRDAAFRVVLDQQHAAFSKELAGVERERFVARAALLDNHGHCTRPEVYESLVRELALPATLARVLTEDFRARYPGPFCRTFPGVVEMLAELRHRGKKLGLVTNGRTVVQRLKVDVLGLRGSLDTVLISEAEGVRKPDPVIFQRAAARLGVAPHQCCHVGDHPEADVAGARAAGLQAIWKRVPDWQAPSEVVPVIDALGQVLDHVR